MFSVMLDTDYMAKPQFKENFWGDWRKILGKNHTIQNLENCDFKPIYEWHQAEKEKKKLMTTEVSYLKILPFFGIISNHDNYCFCSSRFNLFSH